MKYLKLWENFREEYNEYDLEEEYDDGSVSGVTDYIIDTFTDEDTFATFNSTLDDVNHYRESIAKLESWGGSNYVSEEDGYSEEDMMLDPSGYMFSFHDSAEIEALPKAPSEYNHLNEIIQNSDMSLYKTVKALIEASGATKVFETIYAEGVSYFFYK